MADGQPVNDNPALQAKLNEPAPAPTQEPAPSPAPQEPASQQAAPSQQEPAQNSPAPAAGPGAPAGVELPEPEKPSAKWEPTGNRSLDTVGKLFESKGFDGSTALSEFREHGEISQETYDEMVQSLGAVEAELAYNQFSVAVGELKAAAQKEADAIYETVGGQEVWRQIADYTKAGGLDEAERAEYNKLLKAGGKAAQLAAKELKDRMMADPNFKSRADLVGGSNNPAAGGAPPAQEMLDRKTYSERIKAAERRGDPAEINKVRQAGLHSMKNNPYWKVGNPK